MKKMRLVSWVLWVVYSIHAQKTKVPREHILLDRDWTFALGHADYVARDFITPRPILLIGQKTVMGTVLLPTTILVQSKD